MQNEPLNVQKDPIHLNDSLYIQLNYQMV